jgi:hypothetical protein
VSRINSGGHRATIGKRLAYLGTDPIRAQKNLEEFVAKESEKERSLHRVALVNFLCRRNLSFSPPDSRGRFKTFGLGSVFCGHGAIVVSENFPRRSSDSPIVHAAIGRVLLARQLIDPSARAVVVCYTEETPPELIEAGRALGVEFLTPDELVASIKGEDSRESA